MKRNWGHFRSGACSSSIELLLRTRRESTKTTNAGFWMLAKIRRPAPAEDLVS